MDVFTETLKISCLLYKRFNFSRKDVTFIINLFNDFIKNVHNPHLLNELTSSISRVVDEEIFQEISRIVKNFEIPFGHLDSEDKRLRLYKKLNMYQEPEVHHLGNLPRVSARKNILTVKQKKDVSMHMSVEYSLEKLFEKTGLMEASIARYNYLMAHKDFLSNHVQSEAWAEQLQFFEENVRPIDDDIVVLPLIGFCDVVDPGNANGSHAGKDSLGNFSVTCPCSPPSLGSKMESVLVTDIFYTKHRKKYGNSVIFEKLVRDLNALLEKPKEYTIQVKSVKVYFVSSLITGDNKALNEILEYIVYFVNSQCCRTCYATPEQIKSMIQEDVSLLRTVERYEEDIRKLEQDQLKQVNGYTGRCYSNNVKGWHAVNRKHLDLMHDVFEGMGNSEMTKILLSLVDDGHITIQNINDILDTVNFGFETTNLPPLLSLDYIRENQRLKMSASESLFFIRYLGVMIGHLVPDDCEAWSLYKKLREIVIILTSPEATEGDLSELSDLMPDHHALPGKLFGHFTLKLHNALHYLGMIKRNGPQMSICGLKFESKNREIKATLSASASNVNVLKTVATRLQLNLMHYQFSTYQDQYITYGSEIVDSDLSLHFPLSQSKKTVKFVTINDFTYSSSTIIVTEIEGCETEFGEIERVYVVDGEIYFKYVPHYSIGFNSKYSAFAVCEISKNRKLIKYESLPSRVPCLLYQSNQKLLIATRHRLWIIL